MSDELAEILDKYRANVVYVPNIGNAGDAFIAHATYQLFERLGVKYEMGNIAGLYPNRVIICGGGGNLVSEYNNMATFLKNNHNTWRTLVILPHTIRSHGEVFDKMNSSCFIFCREERSLAFAKANAAKANLFLSHDLAFGCRLDETAAKITIKDVRDVASFVANLRRNARLQKRLSRDQRRAAMVAKRGTLNAFRTDAERTGIIVPCDNIDVSESFADNSMEPLVALHTTYRMLCFLKQFNIVRTNRLHVAIMSAKLGLDVQFYDNSYGKNRDIYERSMRGRYRNVRWHSSIANCDG